MRAILSCPLTGFPVRLNGPFPRPGHPFTAGRAQRRSGLAAGHRRRRRGAASTAASTARHWRSRGTRSAYHHRVRHAVCAGVRLQYQPHAEVVLPRRRSATGHRGSMRPGRPLRHRGLRGPVAPCLRHWFALGKSGQPRPYVRPTVRGCAAGHHGCALACQAPFCRACSWHETAIGIA